MMVELPLTLVRMDQIVVLPLVLGGLEEGCRLAIELPLVLLCKINAASSISVPMSTTSPGRLSLHMYGV